MMYLFNQSPHNVKSDINANIMMLLCYFKVVCPVGIKLKCM